MADKTESNPRGAGRKATGVQRVSMNISGTREQIEELKELAEKAGETVSEFVFEKAGITMRNYYAVIVNERIEDWFYTRKEAEDFAKKYNGDISEINNTDSGVTGLYADIVRGIKNIALATGKSEYQIRQRIKEDEEYMAGRK